jgi:hypothetical protein
MFTQLIRHIVAVALVTGSGATATTARDPGNADPGNAVTHWNRIASDVLPIAAGPIIDSRAMAIVQAAVHDAVNAIEPRYEPYTYTVASPGASLDAAVASAAHDVLVALAPSAQPRVDREYAAALASVTDGAAKEAGVSLGQAAARANLERRAGDGVVPGPWPPMQGPIAEPVYVPTGQPGDYDFTPPFDAPPLGPIALFPGWGRLTPFAADLARHRLDGPDPLTSGRYARDLAFLKSYGRLHSTTRSADQSETAFFWFESEPMWNDIARDVLLRQRADPWRAAQVFALVNFALVDGSIATFEAKYRFRFWRPYTAIRRAADDGNDKTHPDGDWLPLLWTPPGEPPTFIIPPIPDYPSTAALTSAAAAEVLTLHLGRRERFEVTSPTLPGVTRRFSSFRQAAEESGMSRVYGGIHFLRAVHDGLEHGKAIGRDVARRLPRVER